MWLLRMKAETAYRTHRYSRSINVSTDQRVEGPSCGRGVGKSMAEGVWGQPVSPSLTLWRTPGKRLHYTVPQFARQKMIAHRFGSELFRAVNGKTKLGPEIS